jgi:hypothetical protein
MCVYIYIYIYIYACACVRARNYTSDLIIVQFLYAIPKHAEVEGKIEKHKKNLGIAILYQIIISKHVLPKNERNSVQKLQTSIIQAITYIWCLV